MGIVLETQEDIDRHLGEVRKQGRTIVTTNGCFDIINKSHIRMLKEAAAQGDVLVVGLNSDESIHQWKGPTRPIRNQDERAEILAAIGYVDFVVLFDERDCTEFVRRVKPDVHVNDASYGENCVEAGAVRESGGKLHLIPKFAGESNSQLIERIRKLE
ncbi:MAG: adenylyltransferase/cytidyltransferase family protein [Candidatus Omnitrophica bacterium]|nr:adenylyltransferase/cytidyltransferase family protein [Candidatus Omnitrophota bacterium]MCA9415775.1 adenylyltransferase/cytidyltransferase family protein [Candidatus Omnitrophota bacterium]MCA9428913.1 adenylyltransferase/cytidyltransferase family protein [Candidatus Omnitrophota bacterium]MCA9434603.1 adenylyltransferase/cytidyltransferase family protein [Candidatus Omnitrophota bacterium]MCA9439411.1 adenylyltransferase/cytidyltransferase family protein [Candidatus Omnitrophota bacterium